MTVFDLPNDTDTDNLKYTSLLNVGNNSILSTAQGHYFGVPVHEASKQHSDKHYIKCIKITLIDRCIAWIKNQQQ